MINCSGMLKINHTEYIVITLWSRTYNKFIVWNTTTSTNVRPLCAGYSSIASTGLRFWEDKHILTNQNWNKRAPVKDSISSQDKGSKMTFKDLVLNRGLKGPGNWKTTRMGKIDRWEKEKGWVGDHFKNESKIHNSRIFGKK